MKSKNIHVLPTDKPSRIYLDVNKELQIRAASIYNRNVINQYIYITSDEEIKERDWCYDSDGKQILQFNNRVGVLLANQQKEKYGIKSYFKILLTTDQELIKEGVQAIDDEFLEWFVKNPSCEFVKVYYKCDKSGCYLKEWNTCCKEAKPVLTLFAENESKAKYFREQEIIPKEEPKPFKQMEQLTEVDWEKFKKSPFPSKKVPKKIFDLPIATNLGSALTETMKSVSQHEGGIKHGEINLPNFKEEVCTCTDECLGYLTKSCKRIEEPKQESLSWDELIREAGSEEQLIKILKLPHIAPLVREAMKNECKK